MTMIMFITTISIFVITSITALARRFLPFSLCPICAGVSVTWMWLLTAWLTGTAIDARVIALLMGGSVVGIAYKAEQIFSIRSPLLWKTLFIPTGFVVVFSVLERAWMAGGTSMTILVLIALWFLLPMQSSSTRVSKLEEKMKDCC